MKEQIISIFKRILLTFKQIIVLFSNKYSSCLRANIFKFAEKKWQVHGAKYDGRFTFYETTNGRERPLKEENKTSFLLICLC